MYKYLLYLYNFMHFYYLFMYIFSLAFLIHIVYISFQKASFHLFIITY